MFDARLVLLHLECCDGIGSAGQDLVVMMLDITGIRPLVLANQIAYLVAFEPVR